MSTIEFSIIGLTLFASITMVGIFRTKTPGFGRYSSSLVILLSVVFVASLFLLLDQLTSQIVGNLLFAIAGYAGGLIGGKKAEA